MVPSDDAINALREALRVSPTNIPLHKHLAESLLKLGRFDEAETAYREALAIAPHNVELKLGLAGAYYQQQKNSPALVIIEDLLEASDPPAAAYIWHAKLLIRAGEPQRAAYQYRQGVEIDAAVADEELARELGVTGTASDYEDDEVVDGRIRQRAGDLPGQFEADIERRWAPNWFGLCLAVFVVAVVTNLVWGLDLTLLVAGFAVGMALPLVTIYQCDIGWPRQSMTSFAAAMAAVGTLAILFSAIGHEPGSLLLFLFLIGFVATPWVANYLATATATR